MAQENHGATQNDLIAYAAGLFDGEGCVVYKQYRVKKGCMKWHINLEIAMTELDCVHWFYNIVKTGTIHYKKNQGLGKKPQWRWRCSHRDAYFVCLALYEHSKVKALKLQKIIDHYSKKDGKTFNGKVVNLNEYKEAMSLE
mgnify:CR=1 FL=1